VRRLGLTLTFSICLVASFGFAPAALQERGELDVLAGAEASGASTALSNYLTKIALELIQQREQQGIATLSNPEAIVKRQAYVRERILRAVGGLPDRTPLNPRTVGVLQRDGYSIEKVIFESQPGLYVTANLYLPGNGTPPYPGILVPLGHESGAKAHDAWQRLLVTFARNGFVALTYDPIGQGERIQLYDPDLKGSKAKDSTKEHTIIGIQCLLTGQNLARYTIWDAMRAVDYLQSRKEVDPNRIGCTGNSGGGTMTAYLSTLDARITVAAPSCYITSWRQLLQTIGPQDAEQCMPPFLFDGLDQPDFVEAFAPKPYLILSAIRDFFPIAGARQSFREARRIYGLLGADEKINMVEVDDGHGYSKFRRIAAYRWMSRWLAGSDREIAEPDIVPEREDTLWCTPSGQVSLQSGGETVFSLNLKQAERLLAQRKWPSSAEEISAFRDRIRNSVVRLTAVQKTQAPTEVKRLGEIRRAGYRIERLIFESEAGIPLPSLLFVPDQIQSRNPAVLYVHEAGKSAEAGPGGEIEGLAKAGNVVMAIDLRGMGETAETKDNWASEFFPGYDSAMKALLIGKTLVGFRVQDIACAMDVLSARAEVDPARIAGFGRGSAAVPLLHAAVLDDRFKSLTFAEMLVSYEAVVRQRIHRRVFENTVRGVLELYDLPDLVACLAPRAVMIVGARDPLGVPLTLEETTQAFSRARDVFRMAGAEKLIRIR
jgi:cephalosporin-C deacetylase-like acetyl esterase